jgi:hypothetical protein
MGGLAASGVVVVVGGAMPCARATVADATKSVVAATKARGRQLAVIHSGVSKEGSRVDDQHTFELNIGAVAA